MRWTEIAYHCFLDAFDGAGEAPPHLLPRSPAISPAISRDLPGETPPHLLADDFLSDCAAALAPGGVIVCNTFNGAGGGAKRRALGALGAALSAHFGQLYSLPVVSQEESLVLVARKARQGPGSARKGREGPGSARKAEPTMPRPGRRDLRKAARSAGALCGMRREMRRLLGRMLWVDTRPDGPCADAESSGLREVRPPASSLGAAAEDWEALPEATSACERLRADEEE